MCIIKGGLQFAGLSKYPFFKHNYNIHQKFKVKLWCTTKSAKTFIFVVVVFSVMYNFIRFWEYNIMQVSSFGGNFIVYQIIEMNRTRMKFPSSATFGIPNQTRIMYSGSIPFAT